MSIDLRQSWPVPSQSHPIVIFGAGSIVRDAHLPAYKAARYTVAGICDADADKARVLAKEFGVPALDRAEALAIPEAVFDLATPPSAHSGLLRSIPEGAPVLIQKPMGADLEAATEILQVCRERRLLAAVNFQLRFAPMMVALSDAIHRGLLGRIVDVEMHGVLSTPWGLWSFLDGLPRIEITMHSIHYLDLFRQILGDPLGIHAKTIGHPSHEVAQTRTAVILDYGEDVRGVLSVNHDWHYGRAHQACELRVAGTKGAAVLQLGVNLDYPRGEPDMLRLKLEDGEWQDIPLLGSWFSEAFAGRMHNLQRTAAGEERLISDVEDAWRTMALVEAAYASSAAPATKIEELP